MYIRVYHRVYHRVYIRVYHRVYLRKKENLCEESLPASYKGGVSLLVLRFASLPAGFKPGLRRF